MKYRGHNQPPERHTKHVLAANEDWYPTLAPFQEAPNSDPQFNNSRSGHAFSVSCRHIAPYSDTSWRVCCWGGDDFGLERDGLDRISALKLFEHIQDYTTQQDLRDWGMVPA